MTDVYLGIASFIVAMVRWACFASSGGQMRLIA
jgi:hypothetical protein